jgi:hypothetical protein
MRHTSRTTLARYLVGGLAPLALLVGCPANVIEFRYEALPATSTTSTSSSISSTGGALTCTPGAMASCYDGPPGTEGQGICTPGMHTCTADGSAWGPCGGQVLPQIENCATPEDEDCDGMAPSCKGDLMWAKRFGDGSDQQGTGIAADGAGNVLLTGHFAGSVDFGGGPLASAGSSDVFVAKLGPDGEHLWSKRFGDASAQTAQSIAADSEGNLVITGTFSGAIDFGGGPLSGTGKGDAFVTKLDASGSHVWSKRFGGVPGTLTGGLGIAVDQAGNVVVTGHFSGSVDFGGGPLVSAGSSDVFIAELSADGEHRWSKRFGGPSDQQGVGVAVAPSGDVIVVGWFLGSIDFGGGPLVSAVSDAFTVKLDAGGGHLWSYQSHQAADGAFAEAVGVAMDAAGNSVSTGDFSGTVDFGGGPLASMSTTHAFLGQRDGSGGYLWAKSFGGSFLDVCGGAGVSMDPWGNALVTGHFFGSVDFGEGPFASAGANDVFLAKLGPGGSAVWSKRFGDPEEQLGTSVATDASGNALITGYFSGTIDFGAGSLVSLGGEDIFVAKLSP